MRLFTILYAFLLIFSLSANAQRYPPTGGSVPTYINQAALPVTATDGSVAVTIDTDTLWIFNLLMSTWLPVGNPSTVFALGNFGSTPNAKGLSLSSNTLTMQPADGTHPGGVSITTQTFAGQKTFSTGLTGTLTGAASLNVLTSALGNLTDAGTDGIIVTGGSGAIVGTTSLAQHVADTTHNGYLSSTDWNTFNGKQASGNYITALTGDVTASGPGSVAATLATVNTNTGSFGSSTSIPNFTVNGKGLMTAAGSNVVIAPAGTLTGTTLASGVVTSSLTMVGTIGTGTWQGTAVDVAHGGTGIASGTSGGIPYYSGSTTIASSGALSNHFVVLGGGAGSAPKVVASAGNSGDVLTSNGASADPTYQTPAAATFHAPTAQNFVASGTYTKPTSPAPLYIKVVAIGPGGGGGGSGSGTPTDGGNGSASTTFGTGASQIIAGAGSGGGNSQTVIAGGAGGTTAQVGSGNLGFGVPGGAGEGGLDSSISTVPPVGGNGASGPYGGGGRGGVSFLSKAATVGTANSGSGGGAGGGSGGGTNESSGGGGGAGAYVEATITGVLSATYSVVIGTGGAAGAGSTGQNGAAGADGLVVVYEFYQ